MDEKNTRVEEKTTAMWNELLRYQRLRLRERLLEEIAGQLTRYGMSVSARTVRRWEEGESIPHPGHLRALCDLYGKTRSQLGYPEEGKPFWNIRRGRNALFTGRENILARLYTTTQNRDERRTWEAPVKLRPQVLTGLGGVGKTQIALEYAYRYQQLYHTIVLLHADDPAVVAGDFAAIARLVQLPAAKFPQKEDVLIQAVKAWLDDPIITKWLLIYDNVRDFDVLANLLPFNRHGHVLITTQSQIIPTDMEKIEVEVMGIDEGTQLLLAYAGISPSSHDEQVSAQNLSTTLGGLPLALAHAGAFINGTGESIEKYSAMFSTPDRTRLLQYKGQSEQGYQHTVATTWRFAFQKLETANPAAAELLNFFAFLHTDIPEEIITENVSRLGPLLERTISDPIALNQAMQDLRTFSLIQRSRAEKSLTIHNLVQTVIKDSMSSETQREWAKRAVLAVNAAFPNAEHGSWPQCERLLPHALLAAHYIEADHIISKEAGRLLHETATYLLDRARYAVVEPLFQRAIGIREQLLGPEHPDVAYPLNGLAILYHEQGKYAEAGPLYLRALRIREQRLGPEHLLVAEPLTGLGRLHREQGQYAKAEPLYQRALRIREQHLGPVHPLVAIPLNSLALLYRDQGRYVEAEPLFQRALRIREQHLGPQHPLVATSLNNLAILYQEQGRYVEAEPLHQRALRIREQHLGPVHPLVATSLNNLGDLYRDQGRYVEAEPLFQRALRIWEQLLGPEHPDVAYPLNNLGDLYRDRGRYVEAEPLYQRALRIWEQLLGPEHPDVAYSLNGLAKLYYEQGKYEQAEPLFQRALYIREQQLVATHPYLAETIHDLAQLREAQGNSEEARTLYAHALAIREQALVEGHARTMETRKCLTALLHAMGRHEEAAQFEQGASEEE